MRRTALLIFAFLMLTLPTMAQEFSDLNEVKAAVEQKLHQTMKGWECHDIEPLRFENTPPSEDLRIQQ